MRFEARWLVEEGCDGIVKDAWEGAHGPRVSSKLATVMKSLDTWSHEVLGDLRKRIKKIKSELEQVRQQPLSERMVRREQTLCF